jgi:hypothetical protein
VEVSCVVAHLHEPGRVSSKVRWAALVSVAVATGLLVFSPALNTFFVADDLNEIGEAVLAPPVGRLSGDELGFLRPLFRLSVFLEHAAFGLDPLPMHVSNVLWHCATAVCVVLLVGALRRSFRAAELPSRNRRGSSTSSLDDPVALLAGAVFLVMPNHVEPVAWIAARADLMATAAMSLALLIWVQRGTTARGVAGSSLAFALALGSKESAVVLPAVLSSYEVCRAWTPSEGLRAFLGRFAAPAAHWLVLGAYLVARWAALGSPFGGYGAELYSWTEPATTLRLLLSSVARSALPPLPALGWIFVVLVLLVLGWVGARRVWRRRTGDRRSSTGWPPRRVTFAVLAGVTCLLPTAPLGVDLDGTMGERTVYLASVFAAWVVAEALVQLGRARRSVGLWTTCAVVGVGAAMTLGGAFHWRATGEVNRSVTAQALRWPTDRSIFVLNLPGSVDGDVGARNVLPGGLQVLQPDAPHTDITVLAYQSMVSRGDRVAQLVVQDQEDGIHVRLELDAGLLHPQFESGRTANGDGFRVTSSDRRSLSISFDRSVSSRQVWYFDDGALRSLDDPATADAAPDATGPPGG